MKTAVMRNAWYAVAWTNEVGRHLLERTVLGESLVVYRREDGTPVVMSNRCPHRFAPLHMGKIVGDCVQCPYHGLQFDSTGTCFHNPHGKPITGRLNTYPVVEKHNLIWMWAGDATKAHEKYIADFSCLSREESGFQAVTGVIEMDAHYELVSDNLLDLTHASFVHEGSLGSEAFFRAEREVKVEGSTVWSNLWCPNDTPPPVWDIFEGKPVDHWLYIRWDAPAHMLLDVGVTRPGGTRADGLWVLGANILTPIDDASTRYFWAISRNFDLDNAERDAQTAVGIDKAFGQQDKPMIEAQQRMMGDISFQALKPRLMATDMGPMRVREVLRHLIESNAVPSPARSKLADKMSIVKDLEKVEMIV